MYHVAVFLYICTAHTPAHTWSQVCLKTYTYKYGGSPGALGYQAVPEFGTPTLGGVPWGRRGASLGLLGRSRPLFFSGVVLLAASWACQGSPGGKKRPPGSNLATLVAPKILLSGTIVGLLACFVFCYAIALCWLLGLSMFTSFRALRKKDAYALRPTKNRRCVTCVFYVSSTRYWPPSALARKEQEAKTRSKQSPKKSLTTKSINFRTSPM